MPCNDYKKFRYQWRLIKEPDEVRDCFRCGDAMYLQYFRLWTSIYDAWEASIYYICSSCNETKPNSVHLDDGAECEIDI